VNYSFNFPATKKKKKKLRCSICFVSRQYVQSFASQAHYKEHLIGQKYIIPSYFPRKETL